VQRIAQSYVINNTIKKNFGQPFLLFEGVRSRHLVQAKILETAGRQERIPGESVHNPGDDHIGDPFVVRCFLHDRDAQVEEIDAIEAQEAEDG
jgi:hypothetical protein